MVNIYKWHWRQLVASDKHMLMINTARIIEVLADKLLAIHKHSILTVVLSHISFLLLIFATINFYSSYRRRRKKDTFVEDNFYLNFWFSLI